MLAHGVHNCSYEVQPQQRLPSSKLEEIANVPTPPSPLKKLRQQGMKFGPRLSNMWMAVFPGFVRRSMGDLFTAKEKRVQLWKVISAFCMFLLCFLYMGQGSGGPLLGFASGIASSRGVIRTSEAVAGSDKLHLVATEEGEQLEGDKQEEDREEQAGSLSEKSLNGRGEEEDREASGEILTSTGEEPSAANDRSLRPTCDLYQGQWVKGEPLYEGTKCSILATQWACRKSKRTDFGYENWRWRPTDCDLPSFDADDFLERLRNKAVVFMGDSLGQQQFQSILCMLSKGDMEKNAKDVGLKYSFLPPLHGPQRPNGTAYLFEATNTTIILKGNAFLGDIVPEDVSHPSKGGYLHIDRMDSWLRRNFWWIDVLVVNTGHHWGWHGLQAAKLTPMENGIELKNSRRAPVHAKDMKERVMGRLMRFLDQAAAARQDPKPLIYFRALSPRHFLDGEWNTGGRCDNVKTQFGSEDLKKRPTIDMDAEIAIRGRKHVKLLNVTYLSQFRGEAHLSVWWLNYDAKSNVQDCLHWCLPGVPDTWNEILYANVILNDQNPKQRTLQSNR